ncbi:hypothetical protein BH24ACT15_BH24ACT15_22900 [soil metagenome]
MAVKPGFVKPVTSDGVGFFERRLQERRRDV